MPDAAAHKLQETVDEITGYSRRTRKLVWGLIAVTAACTLVAALAVFLYVRLHDDQVGNCAAGNETKVQQEQLWDTLFSLSAQDGNASPSAKTRQLTSEFLRDVKVTYAPTDCAVRYPFW